MLSSNKYIWGGDKHSKALKGYLLIQLTIYNAQFAVWEESFWLSFFLF